MWYWIAIYFYFVRKSQQYNKNIYLHSIFHCVLSALFNTYILFGNNYKYVLSSEVGKSLQTTTNSNNNLLNISVSHSLGYFIADTLDILVDYYTEPHKRKYLIHHLFAISGIMSSYLGSYLCIYAIWALEIGGIFYHLKYVGELYNKDNTSNKMIYLTTQALYHICYY